MRYIFFLLPFFLGSKFLIAAPEKLFDGATLEGWEGEKSKVWRVSEGLIVGGSLEGNPHNEFLSTKGEYRNFRFSLEYKLVGTEGFVNSGVQFRSQRLKDPAFEMIGYQADIGAGYTGCLYDESRRKVVLAKADEALIKGSEKQGDWNRYEILAEGSRVRIFLNGQQTIDYIEKAPGISQKGHIALQIHGDAKSEVSFRNIRVEALPDDLVPSSEEVMLRFGAGDGNANAPAAFGAGGFSISEGDAVVFVGQENLVREQKSGILEARISAAYPEAKPIFRSMAWEGDTVQKQWRDLNFGSWADQLKTVGADVVIGQFGQTESFAGEEGLPEFVASYERLLDQFGEVTGRMVLLSPTPFENPGGYLPDLEKRNDVLAKYVAVVDEIAKRRKAIFVDVFSPFRKRQKDGMRLTDDGWHLNDDGLKAVAKEVAKVLALPAPAVEPSALQAAIVEKNRLFFNSWRPANWSFVYGDRVSQNFGKAPEDFLSLREAFESHRPLIGKWDGHIHRIVAGNSAAVEEPKLDYPATESMLSVEEEKAGFELAPGYEVNLFASEELGVAKPVQFIWDEKGRLWVACSPTYPHILPGSKPGDFILVLEDTDHDGKADKSWKFAENLTMVQGLEFGDGGLYVCDFDRLIHLTDTDGDGKSDLSQTVLAGFGIGDTHQLINSLTYGPAGKFWFGQGLHAFSRVETPHGLAVLEKAGLWRMDRRTRELEPFFNGGMAGHNCWGVAFDDFGQVFHKSGDRPFGYWSVPGLTSNPNPDDYHPVGPLFDTSPKTTSLEFVGTRGLPEELQGTALIAGYFGSVVEAHKLSDSSSGFKSEQLPRLMKSSNTAFRPVDVSVGPDGSIYLADWFNPVIGHYQASYADPERDRRHGRIWRISAKGIPPVKQPDLASMDAAELLAQLNSPERWTRYQAKRLLFNLPSDVVVPAADELLKSITDNRILLELAGVFQAHAAIRPGLLSRLLASPDFRVRAYGARLLGEWHSELEACGSLFDKTIHDVHPRVRLEAVVAISRMTDLDAVSTALKVLDSPMDRFIDYALAQTVKALRENWQPLMEAGELKIPDGHLVFLRGIEASTNAAVHPGKVVYDSLCLNCHQPGGLGLPGVYPPLANSEWLQGNPERLVRILMHGLNGPVKVGNVIYGENPAVPMPPMGLDDRQIADVLSYLRTAEFANPAPPVSTEVVKQIRDATANRKEPWTVAELNELQVK